MDFRTVTVEVSGEPWRLRFCETLGEYEGLVLHDKRLILVAAAEVADMLETLLHETLHAAAPYLDEAAVEEIAKAQRHAVEAWWDDAGEE